jgi:predicted nuclease of restriction endonuclease-like (RecB) superfamily
VLFQKIKAPALRVWYAQKVLLHGWSRNILEMQIETSLHQYQGKALHNFPATMPPTESYLAGQILKDPYNFEFLASCGASFWKLVRSLPWWAAIRLTVGDEDYYIAFLFYHIHLRCYAVVELKAAKFKPAFVRQLNFYLSAIDDSLRRGDTT